MEVYDMKNLQKNYIAKVQDVIETLRNKYREKGECRLKFNVKNVKDMDVDDILDDRKHFIYWCILRNNHAVAMVEKYIFDPEFNRTLPRNRTGIRISSETESHEPIEGCIDRCYQIENTDDL